MHVAGFLDGGSLGCLTQRSAAEANDRTMFLTMSQHDLTRLGVPTFGLRCRLVLEMEALLRANAAELAWLS